MTARRMLRLGLLRTAVALGILLSLLTLVVPNECLNQLDFTGLSGGWGVGMVQASDLTPATVDNSTSGAALMAPSQRKLFHASGRFWIFYSDGTDLVYRSSSDGIAWSDKSASLGTGTAGTGISVFFDGTYVHYARTTATNNQALYYRRGLPNADGTITWSASEQTALPAAIGVRYMYPSVSTDSSGHALISYHHEKQNGKAGEGPCITMSGSADGTWGTTPAGFPRILYSESESEWYTTVHGLTSNKIAVTFADHTEVKMVYVATYDGTSWNATVSTASTAHFGSDYSVVAQGDDLHIVLLDEATFDIRYYKYTYATNSVGAEYTIQGAAAASSAPALAMDSGNDLYCFWLNSPADGHIYYRKMISGEWSDNFTDWLTETNLTASGGVSTFCRQADSAYIGVAWQTGLASPYDIRFGAVETPVVPNEPPDRPVNVSPVDGAVDQPLTPTLQGSSFSDDGDTHAASRWQISTTAGVYTSPVFDSFRDTANLTSIAVPSGTLEYSTGYYWHVSYQDSQGAWSQWSVETSFTTCPAPNQPPDQPANLSPSNGATDQSQTPTLQSSAYLDGNGDTHAASQWQITSVSGSYSSPVFDSGTDSVNLVSILIPSGSLANSTTYYWHMRHQDSRGAWSAWSAETSFTTCSAPNHPPDQPVNLSPSDGATDQSQTPTLQSSTFVDPDGDSHAASQWQITSLFGDYSSPVFDSGTDSVNLVSILVPSGSLANSTTYYWHVRHQDSQGAWSAWSAETTFTTCPAPNQPPDQPANIAPASGATDQSLTPTLQSSSFVDPDGDSHAASQWQITSVSGNYSAPIFDSQTDSVNLDSILVPSGSLANSTTYYWHVRHQDSQGAWSDWSAETSFSIAAPPSEPPNHPPEQPSNVSPTSGVTDLSPSPLLRSSGFADPDGDSHLATQWQITTEPGDYSSPIFDSQTDTANLLSILVSSGNLAHSTTYCWRVRYQDSDGTWSDWSGETSFTTCAEPPPPAPPPSPEAPEAGGGFPSWAVIGIEAALGLLATLIIGVGAYFACGSLLGRGAATSASSGLSCVDAISKRLKEQDKDQ